MKKLLQFSFIYCLILFFSIQANAQSYELKLKQTDKYTYEAALTIFDMETASVIINGEKYKKFNIKKGSNIHTPGMPSLPVIQTFITAPSGAYSIEIIEQETESLSALPVPAAPLQYRNNKLRDTLPQPASVYFTNEKFPVQIAEIANQGKIGAAAVATLLIYPVIFDAADKSVAISKKVRFKIRFSQPIPENGKEFTNRAFSYENVQINAGIVSSKKNNNSNKTPHLLILTHDDFYEAILPFAAWKRKKGLQVEVKKTSDLDEILYSETIKAALQAAYDAGELDYVLLVGDHNFIPPDLGLNNSLTDHTYSLLAGEDYFPDVAIGRFSVKTAAECAVYVDKLLAYEQLKEPANWYNRATVIASDDFNDNNNGLQMVQVFEGSGFEKVDDLRQRINTNTAYNVNVGLNEGRSWVFFIGHGNAYGWLSVLPEFGNNALAALQANNTLPTVVSIACANADIDIAGDDCFAEKWMHIEKGKGASNILAATEDVAFFWSDTLGKQTVISYLNRDAETFGEAVNHGKMKMYEAFPEHAGGITNATMEQFILLGEPTQMPWTAAPAPLTVEAPAEIQPGKQQVTIKVNKKGAAVEGAMVCLSNAELQFAGYTDENGEVVLQVDVQEGIFDMVVSGYNLQVYQKEVQVKEQLIASPVRLDVYPNPSSDIINFSYQNTLPKRLLITDIQGKTIFSSTDVPAHKMQYDAAALPAGVYFYTFIFEDGSRFGGKIILK